MSSPRLAITATAPRRWRGRPRGADRPTTPAPGRPRRRGARRSRASAIGERQCCRCRAGARRWRSIVGPSTCHSLDLTRRSSSTGGHVARSPHAGAHRRRPAEQPGRPGRARPRAGRPHRRGAAPRRGRQRRRRRRLLTGADAVARRRASSPGATATRALLVAERVGAAPEGHERQRHGRQRPPVARQPGLPRHPGRPGRPRAASAGPRPGAPGWAPATPGPSSTGPCRARTCPWPDGRSTRCR